MSDLRAEEALRHFEIDAVRACLGTALLGFVITTAARGVQPALNVAAGVLCGGLLMAVSYRSIKGAAELLSELGAARIRNGAETAPEPPVGGGEAAAEPAEQPADSGQLTPPALSGRRRAFIAVKFLLRYALLAVAAYVMLMRFRLHPVGLLAGALAPFLAAVLQVGRLSRARARRHTP